MTASEWCMMQLIAVKRVHGAVGIKKVHGPDESKKERERCKWQQSRKCQMQMTAVERVYCAYDSSGGVYHVTVGHTYRAKTRTRKSCKPILSSLFILKYLVTMRTEITVLLGCASHILSPTTYIFTCHLHFPIWTFLLLRFCTMYNKSFLSTLLSKKSNYRYTKLRASCLKGSISSD